MIIEDMPIDELVKKTGSIYKLAILASRRAIELSEGAPKLVSANPDSTVSNIALKEILEGRISYKAKEEK